MTILYSEETLFKNNVENLYSENILNIFKNIELKILRGIKFSALLLFIIIFYYPAASI